MKKTKLVPHNTEEGMCDFTIINEDILVNSQEETVQHQITASNSIPVIVETTTFTCEVIAPKTVIRKSRRRAYEAYGL